MKKQPMKNIDIEYWPNEDGSVGAFIDNVPGAIYAKNAETFAEGMWYVFKQFHDHHQYMSASGETMGFIDLKAEMAWMDGRLCARWPEVPGFGIDFASEDELKEFVKALLIPPNREALKAKLS